MFMVYAIKSQKFDFIYVGMTENLTSRIERHNRGHNQSTKHYAHFEFVYSETTNTGRHAWEWETIASFPDTRFIIIIKY
jgi:putative endonuclease